MSRLNEAGATMNGEPEPLVPSFRTAGEIIVEFPELMPLIIDGLLRRGEVMNIIAASKVGKSWLVMHLLLCVASGRMFLGRYPVFRGRVLLVDNELHPNTLAQRIKIVAHAMGLLRADYADNLCIECMRGKNATVDRLVPYAASIGPGRFDLVVVDALYRTVPRGLEENSNSDMTVVYNWFDAIAASMTAAIVLIHHASKGNQSEKAVIDVGSGAGAITRAADAHFTIRPHEEDNAVVVDAVARSWAPPATFAMRWTFPSWTVDDSLDITQLRKPGNRRKDRVAETDRPVAPEPEPWTVERFVGAFFDEQPRVKKLAFARMKLDRTLSGREATAMYEVALDQRLLYEWPNSDTPSKLVCATREPDLIDVAETVVIEPKKRPGRPRKSSETGVENAA